MAKPSGRQLPRCGRLGKMTQLKSIARLVSTPSGGEREKERTQFQGEEAGGSCEVGLVGRDSGCDAVASYNLARKASIAAMVS